MKIDKAIEILTHMREATNVSSLDDCVKATKLGIEALKEVKKARDGDPALDGELLPGETEE